MHSCSGGYGVLDIIAYMRGNLARDDGNSGMRETVGSLVRHELLDGNKNIIIEERGKRT
jgi:hypothetical protein